MKTKIIIALLLFFTMPSIAQNKKNIIKENISVSGNCGMCKKTIETAAKVKGVKTVKWNAETKILMIKYDGNKISNADIQRKIADVGYDTQNFSASDEVYEKLHGCCKYERRVYEK